MKNKLNQISDLINNQENMKDEKKFKVASATLICSIVNIDKKDAEKYCSLFEENFNLSEDEFNKIKESLLNEKLTIDEKVNYIKTELHDNMYQVMQFLKILNRFAILDGCSQKSYREFEIIRDKFLKSHY